MNTNTPSLSTALKIALPELMRVWSRAGKIPHASELAIIEAKFALSSRLGGPCGERMLRDCLQEIVYCLEWWTDLLPRFVTSDTNDIIQMARAVLPADKSIPVLACDRMDEEFQAAA